MSVKRYAAINIASASLAAHPIHFICDTTAELPSSGLKLGDTALALDTLIHYDAATSTTWTPLTIAATAHGAASHTDITRFMWMTPGAGGVTTPGNLVNGSAGPVYQFPNGSTETVNVDFLLPGDWVSGLGYSIYWIPSASTSALAVRWSTTVAYLAVGADATAIGTTAAFTGANAVRTANVLVAETEQALAAPSAGTIVRFFLSRIGADGADTYTGLAQLAGVRFSYTANQ